MYVSQDAGPACWSGGQEEAGVPWADPLFSLSLFFFISWRLITLQYCSGFCHTLK